MKNPIIIWKGISVAALVMLLAGLVIALHDWDIPCGMSEFRHDILITAAAFIGGIIFEMVTGFFEKIECRHYENSRH